MRSTLPLTLLAVLACSHMIYAAPTDNADVLAKLNEMQEQLNALKNKLPVEESVQSSKNDRFPALSGYAQKRMVAWQPMKRNDRESIDRDTVYRAIEQRLLEVLAAGERLGVAPEEILADLRTRNAHI